MKTKIAILSLMPAVNFSAAAALIFNSGSISLDIPDNNTLGTADTLNCTASGLGSSITDVILVFQLQGGVSSDLSGYLRLGDTGSSPYYDLTSFIHASSLTLGTPTTYTLAFSTPTYGSGFENVFSGLNPNSNWTLFFEDTLAGDQTTAKSWSLDITAVPEPTALAGLIFGGALMVFLGVKTYYAQRRIESLRRAVNDSLDAA